MRGSQLATDLVAGHAAPIAIDLDGAAPALTRGLDPCEVAVTARGRQARRAPPMARATAGSVAGLVVAVVGLEALFARTLPAVGATRRLGGTVRDVVRARDIVEARLAELTRASLHVLQRATADARRRTDLVTIRTRQAVRVRRAHDRAAIAINETDAARAARVAARTPSRAAAARAWQRAGTGADLALDTTRAAHRTGCGLGTVGRIVAGRADRVDRGRHALIVDARETGRTRQIIRARKRPQLVRRLRAGREREHEHQASQRHVPEMAKPWTDSVAIADTRNSPRSRPSTTSGTPTASPTTAGTPKPYAT